MVACQSSINKVIVPAAVYLEKVRLGMIYVSWKIPISLPPPSFSKAMLLLARLTQRQPL